MSVNAGDRASLANFQRISRDLSALLVRTAKTLTTKRHPTSPIRHTILINSMVRAARTGDAQLLLSEGLYSEEMQCLNRTLAEISINAAYLQIATEAEIDDYLRYDSLATARVVQKISTSTRTPHLLDQAEKQHIRQLLEQPTNQSGTMPSWSAKTVHVRARALDKECGVDLMTSTALVIYSLTHLDVHGTASSVAKVGAWVLRGSDRNDPDRLRSTVVALSGTAVCLSALADFVGQRYQLGLDSEMKRLHEKMNT